MLWIVIASIIAGLLLLEVIVQFYFARVMLRDFESKLTSLKASPIEPDAVAEPIEFTTADGITLRGSLHGNVDRSPRGLIIFCPELNGGHWSAAEYCRGPIEAGFLVLSFDFGDQGESDSRTGYEPLHWLTDHELRDVRAALEFVRSRTDLRELPVGLMGFSRGGTAALAAAALDRSVKAVVVEGAFSTDALQMHYTIRRATMYAPAWFMNLVPAWHIKVTLMLCRWMSERRRNCRYTNLERLLPRLSDRPVLLIAGGHDTYVPIEVARVMASQIAGEECEIWKVRDARHNRARRVDEEAYDDRIREFFQRNLEVLGEAYDSEEFEAAEDVASGYARQSARQPTAS